MTTFGDSPSAIDYDGMTPDQLKALLRQRDALNGVEIEFASGFLKNDPTKPWSNVTVSGGVFGYRDRIKLKPRTWMRLKELTAEIDKVMAKHYPDEFSA